jgi:hypothetical protein
MKPRDASRENDDATYFIRRSCVTTSASIKYVKRKLLQLNNLHILAFGCIITQLAEIR